MNCNLLEKQLAELPLVQYAFIKTEDVEFSERIRWICEHECPMFGHSWSCPPAVGSVEECERRCKAYPEALLIATAAEVNDASDMGESLATRTEHEAVTRQALALVRQQAADAMALSAQACTICESCAWPKEECRRPEMMFPCVESHGIVVSALAEKVGVEFAMGGGVVTWFSLIFYR